MSVNCKQTDNKNQVDCHADKSARNDVVCHYEERSDEVIQKPLNWIATKIRDFLAMTKNCLMFTKAIAFTLAETLIVMGIIGVVAALTLPNLNQSTNNKEKVVKVKKVYQNLNDAIGRAQAVYGPVDEWFVNDSTQATQTTRFGERLTEFMKLSKNCKMTKGCYDSGSGTSSSYQFILADGTSVSLDASINSVSFNVDIDGLNKGKGGSGIDLFRFIANPTTNFSVEPCGGGSTYTYGASKMLVSCPGQGCARWVIDYDNMDYLKLDSSGKCPNGRALDVEASPPVVSCN